MANDFEPRVGHKFQFRAKPQPGWNGITVCEVTEVKAPKRLAYTWNNTEGTLQTVVRWTLEPQGAGTKLVLEHDGFEGFKHVLLSFMMGSGWKRMLRKKFEPAMRALETSSLEPQGPDAHCEESDTLAHRVVGKIAGS